MYRHILSSDSQPKLKGLEYAEVTHISLKHYQCGLELKPIPILDLISIRSGWSSSRPDRRV